MRPTLTEARIQLYQAPLHGRVVQHILDIEQREFGLDISFEEQPDLLDIDSTYERAGGRFWVALADERVVGTLALFNLGNGDAELRRLYVSTDHRGGRPSLAARLFDAFLQFARAHDYKRIFLETNKEFATARFFYEKHGFVRIPADELPASFPTGPVADGFYRLLLR